MTTTETAVGGDGARWRVLGRVELDPEGRLCFPATADEPAVYRLAYRRDGVMHAYVGETVRLRRRLQRYRTPDPSQETNLRINPLLRGVLAEGLVVTVAALAPGPGDDLGTKPGRVRLEAEALGALRRRGAVLHNRVAG